MARSAFVEVNITNPTRLAQDSQDTADKAVKGVTDLNDPNLMSVIEKQNNIVQFAGLTSQLNVLVQNAKDDGIDTTAVTTAYNNLNTFMADILADPNHASDIDRARYNKYQNAYNEELAKLQNALQNNTNDKFTSAASALSQVASTANVAKSAADSTYAYANSEIAIQSTATAKAQSAADGAFSQAQVVGSQADSAIAVQSTATVKAQSAADNAFSQAQAVGSQASVEISKNSVATAKAQSTADNAFNKAQEVGNQASSEIAVQSEATAKAQNTADNAFSEAQSIGSQASSEIAVQSNATAKAQSTADSAFSQAVTAIDTGKATSQAVTALKDGSTLTIAQLGNGLASKVSNSEYASYKEQTASQIGQMVTNGAFSAYQQTTADLISSKVATKDFTAYQATTAKSIDSKVESSDFNTYKTQTANLISEKVSNSEYASNKEQTASQIADRVSNSAFSTYQEQTASQFASKVDNGDFTTYKTQTADLISSKVATKDFSAYQDTTAKAISSKVESSDFNTYKTQTADLINDKVSNSAYASDKTQTASQISQMVSNSAFSAYQTQTASQIAQKVDSGAFSAYQQTTADLISSKVATKDFSAYQATTAKSIESKVESSDFNTYKTQTADAISSKVSSADFNNLKISNRNLALGTAATFKMVGENIGNQSRNAYTFSKTISKGAVVTVTFDVSSTTGAGRFIAQFNGGDEGASWQEIASGDLTKGIQHVSKTFTVDANQSHVYFRLDNATGDIEFSNFIISESSKEVNWTPAPEDQASQSQITQLSGQIDQKVSSGDFNSYKTQTDKLISEKVSNGDFNSYKSQTSELINSKVDNGTYQSDKTQTANAIASKVSSSDFKTYQTQTDKLIESKVDNGTYQSDKTQTANQIADKVSNGAFDTYKTQTDKLIAEKVSNGDFSTYKSQTADLISSKVATKDFSAYQATTAKAIESKVESKDFQTYQEQTDKAISSKVDNGDFSTYKTQTANDINLRVTAKDLIDQINLQAGKTLISSSGQLTLSANSVFLDSANPVIMKSANIDTLLVGKKLTAADISANTFTTNNGTFTVNQNGAITAKDMTLTGGILTSPTINASKINSATINGTTINAGDIINNANNTSHFYPTTISNNGHIYTVQFNSSDAMQTDLSTGSLTTKYRAVNSTGTQYEAYDTMIQANQIALFAGHTNGKDMSFTQSVTGSNQDGYMLLSPLNGITLHGDTQQITFNGTSDDVTPKGIIITPYGNINPNGTQNIWYVGNGPDMKTASFGINADQNVPISFYRQTLVDEIGALGSRLSMGRLFLHATDNDAQMYLLNDGSPAFVSPTVFNRTYSNGANMFVTSAGRIGRSTSASKYKLAIARSDDTVQADRLMTLKPASWNDKVATEKMAESLSNGEIPVEAEINLKRHYGLIAEDLRDAGLDEFLITGKDGQIEGIEYDRLWTVLIPKIKQLNNRINELERKAL